MPKISYIRKRFQSETLDLIDTANAIIEEYETAGYQLTLRQLYYQFVARDLLPNTDRSYDRLGSIVSDARLAGLIDWLAIEDRTRFLRGLNTWNGPGEVVRDAAERYHVDWWQDQPTRPEVWIEKDALVGVIERPCQKWDTDYFACRGYVSQSEMWVAGMRILGRWRKHKQATIIYHLGDHDPSGIDMTRDIEERLMMFTEGNVEVRRLALNMDQVEQYGPPPNPAKLSDARARAYVEQYGSQSWELDALEPRVIGDLVEIAAENTIRLPSEFEERQAQERNERAEIEEAAEQWSE